jgi:hypothetical protein
MIRAGIAVACGLVLFVAAGFSIRAKIESAYNDGYSEAIVVCPVQ